MHKNFRMILPTKRYNGFPANFSKRVPILISLSTKSVTLLAVKKKQKEKRKRKKKKKKECDEWKIPIRVTFEGRHTPFTIEMGKSGKCWWMKICTGHPFEEQFTLFIRTCILRLVILFVIFLEIIFAGVVLTLMWMAFVVQRVNIYFLDSPYNHEIASSFTLVSSIVGVLL